MHTNRSTLTEKEIAEILDTVSPYLKIDVVPIGKLRVLRDPVTKKYLFTEQEINRLRPKLELAEKAAFRLALAMVKGTLKYTSDGTEDGQGLEYWIDHATDEAFDLVNYMMLLGAARQLTTKEGDK